MASALRCAFDLVSTIGSASWSSRGHGAERWSIAASNGAAFPASSCPRISTIPVASRVIESSRRSTAFGSNVSDPSGSSTSSSRRARPSVCAGANSVATSGDPGVDLVALLLPQVLRDPVHGADRDVDVLPRDLPGGQRVAEPGQLVLQRVRRGHIGGGAGAAQPLPQEGRPRPSPAAPPAPRRGGRRGRASPAGRARRRSTAAPAPPGPRPRGLGVGERPQRGVAELLGRPPGSSPRSAIPMPSMISRQEPRFRLSTRQSETTLPCGQPQPCPGSERRRGVVVAREVSGRRPAVDRMMTDADDSHQGVLADREYDRVDRGHHPDAHDRPFPLPRHRPVPQPPRPSPMAEHALGSRQRPSRHTLPGGSPRPSLRPGRTTRPGCPASRMTATTSTGSASSTSRTAKAGSPSARHSCDDWRRYPSSSASTSTGSGPRPSGAGQDPGPSVGARARTRCGSVSGPQDAVPSPRCAASRCTTDTGPRHQLAVVGRRRPGPRPGTSSRSPGEAASRWTARAPAEPDSRNRRTPCRPPLSCGRTYGVKASATFIANPPTHPAAHRSG